MKRLGTAAALLLLAMAVPLAADPPSWSSGTYVYDPSGNIVKIGSDTYTYDLLSRIKIGTAGAGHSQTYTYDPFGNITNIVTDGGASLTPGVDATTNRISLSAGSNAYGTYDAAGNMVTYLGLYTYTYDAANMMKELTGPNSQHEVYLYTVDDERVAAGTVSGSGSSAVVTSYRYTIRGLDAKVLREFDDSITGSTHAWTWKEDFIYASGQLLASESAPRTLHFFSDHLGTPRLITDGAFSQIARHDYYPFGVEATSPAQDAEVMKFTGHERDAALDYMHARHYGFVLGRFLSTDPRPRLHPEQPQSWNAYEYVYNKPMRFTDPTGREGEDKTPNAPNAEPLPHPTGPNGELLPPPVPLPDGKNGQPNEWVPVVNPNPRPGQRPVKWKPRYPVPSPTGGQPSASWDPEGHYDVDIPSPTGGPGVRDRFLPDGTRLGPHHRPVPNGFSIVRLQTDIPIYSVAAFASYMAAVSYIWDQMSEEAKKAESCGCRAR